MISASMVLCRERHSDVAAMNKFTVDPATPSIDLLRDLERKVLWLACQTIHHANHERENVDGLKADDESKLKKEI